MNIKVACHVHSTWSYDGRWPLEQLASEFSQRGYRVLLMTEHDRGFSEQKWQNYREACARASSADMLVVPGIEYSDAANLVHVLTWGNIAFLGENLPTGVMLDAITKAGGVAVLAHPSRKQAWLKFDPAWTTGLAGVEVWNRKTDGWRPSPSGLGLACRTGLPRFCGHDFHDRNQMFPLAMRFNLAGPVTEKSVVECIRTRQHQPSFCNFELNQISLRVLLTIGTPFESARRIIRWFYRRLGASRTRRNSPDTHSRPD